MIAHGVFFVLVRELSSFIGFFFFYGALFRRLLIITITMEFEIIVFFLYFFLCVTIIFDFNSFAHVVKPWGFARKYVYT